MELLLREQQQKRRLLMARQEQDAAMEGQKRSSVEGIPARETPKPSQPSSLSLQDRQMQLLLLEQQNKKRLLMARQKQDAAMKGQTRPSAGGVSAQQTGMPQKIPAQIPDYQMQLMLIEQQNKKRLLMARQEQDAAMEGQTRPSAEGVSAQQTGMPQNTPPWSPYYQMRPGTYQIPSEASRMPPGA